MWKQRVHVHIPGAARSRFPQFQIPLTGSSSDRNPIGNSGTQEARDQGQRMSVGGGGRQVDASSIRRPLRALREKQRVHVHIPVAPRSRLPQFQIPLAGRSSDREDQGQRMSVGGGGRQVDASSIRRPLRSLREKQGVHVHIPVAPRSRFPQFQIPLTGRSSARNPIRNSGSEAPSGWTNGAREAACAHDLNGSLTNSDYGRVSIRVHP
jgi:hypothetical protein